MQPYCTLYREASGRWQAESFTHIGYVGVGATPTEAVESLEGLIRATPMNVRRCEWWDPPEGTPVGNMRADGVFEPRT